MVQESPLHLPPFDCERISHYLCRWYRLETVSISNSTSLSRKLRLGKTLYRWEKFYFNPPPDQEELEKMSAIMHLDIDRLRQMFPPEDEPIKPEPIRLCGACYAEAPYHRLSWQFQSTQGCDRHRLRLVSACRGHKCNERFPIPRDWVDGRCKKCGMKYASQAKYQKPY